MKLTKNLLFPKKKKNQIKYTIIQTNVEKCEDKTGIPYLTKLRKQKTKKNCPK